MDGTVEHELCGNCKKEIPQHNYVMHTAHCSRNITLCQVCKEPIPRNEFDKHKQSCVAVKPKEKKKPEAPSTPASNLERSQYYQERKSVEDKKVAARKERQMQKLEKFVDLGYSMKTTNASNSSNNNKSEQAIKSTAKVTSSASTGLLACKYCELELPKLELEEHENYCGTRTDKCLDCGELVMFKYKQIHMDSNHGFLKLDEEPGPRASWDSTSTRRPTSLTSSRPSRPFSGFDSTVYSFPTTYSTPSSIAKEKGESYKEISRRLDCRAPDIPPRQRRNPATELTIPCEFCSVPIPHEDLIQHETGCRPDLARFNPRRNASPEPDDYFVAPQPSSPEVQLPCEFCADMIPASQLLRHQATCF